jgi:hypothetical protein
MQTSESSDFEDARDAVSETSSSHELFEAAIILKPQEETDAEEQETVAEEIAQPAVEIAQPAVEIAQPAVEITKPADEQKRTHSEEVELARSLIVEVRGSQMIFKSFTSPDMKEKKSDQGT